MSEVLEQINDSLEAIGNSVKNVADDIKRLVAKNADGLSAEEATGVATKLGAVADSIKSVADIVPEDDETGGVDEGGGDTTPDLPPTS